MFIYAFLSLKDNDTDNVKDLTLTSSFSGDGGGVNLISTSEPSEDPRLRLFLFFRNVAGGLRTEFFENVIPDKQV